MCKSQAEGGQRCASHGRDLVTRTKNRYERTADAEDLREWIIAETEYASTREGQLAARAKAFAEVDGPGGLPSDYWTRIAENGSALRDRNDMILQAVGKAKKTGDAFHRAAAATWAPLPESIRSQAKLDGFLDEEARQLSFERTQRAWDAGCAAATLELKDQLEATSPNPDAEPGSLTPRTEEEKQAWLDHLSAGSNVTHLNRAPRVWVPSEGRWKTLPEGQVPVVGEPWCVAPLAAFGRDHSLDPARPLTSRDRGFVGRLRDPDGVLTDSAYLVIDTDADSHVKVQVIDLPSVGSVPTSPARRAQFNIPDGIQVKDLTMIVRPEALERAKGSTWDRFAGRRPRFTFDRTSPLVLDSPAEQTSYAFAYFRKANATKAGMAPKGFLQKLVGRG